MCLDQFSWLATNVFLKRMYCPENVRKIWQPKYPYIDQLASHSPSFLWNFIMTAGKQIGNVFTRNLQTMIRKIPFCYNEDVLRSIFLVANKMLLKKVEKMYCPENVRKIWQRKYLCIDQSVSWGTDANSLCNN